MSTEAFTVGYAKSYDEALSKGTPEKLGRRDDYDGGWIWRTPEEARTFLTTATFAETFRNRDPAEFSVYRLELPTGWEIDVSEAPHSDGVHRLLNDARIIKAED